MTKLFETHWVALVPNDRSGWTLESDGILENQDYSELELEKEIEQLMVEGWALVGSVNHKINRGNLYQRVLYFSREILENES